MIKYLMFVILVSSCYAEQYVYCLVRQSDSAITTQSYGWSTPTTSTMGVPPAGSTWQALPLSTWTAVPPPEKYDGVPTLIVSGGKVALRPDADVAGERAVKAAPKVAADRIQAQIRLDAATKLSVADPTDTAMADQVVKTQAELDALKK